MHRARDVRDRKVNDGIERRDLAQGMTLKLWRPSRHVLTTVAADVP